MGGNVRPLDLAPMRIDDAGCLTDFIYDQRQSRFGNSEDVNCDVENIVSPEFGGYSPWNDI
jgi:hypothetical protein